MRGCIAGDGLRPVPIASSTATGPAALNPYESRTVRPIGQIFLLCGAIMLALGGLLMTGCGAIFTIGSIPKDLGMLILSVPSVLLGIGTLVGAAKLARSALRKQ